MKKYSCIIMFLLFVQHAHAQANKMFAFGPIVNYVSLDTFGEGMMFGGRIQVGPLKGSGNATTYAVIEGLYTNNLKPADDHESSWGTRDKFSYIQARIGVVGSMFPNAWLSPYGEVLVSFDRVDTGAILFDNTYEMYGVHFGIGLRLNIIPFLSVLVSGKLGVVKRPARSIWHKDKSLLFYEGCAGVMLVF